MPLGEEAAAWLCGGEFRGIEDTAIEDTAMPCPYLKIIYRPGFDITIARLIVGTRHCRLLTVGNGQNQPDWMMKLPD
ncbi:hypothetical protein [Microcoleus sp. SVA1B1]|uniref:hypothetical protein n=1 Tax=Microcoleus sp. SVA1B1 TaxID=3055422 RepID=UPI002FD73D35